MALLAASALAACTKSTSPVSDSATDADQLTLVVGTYSDYIALVDFNQVSGEASIADTIATPANPSFMAVDTARQRLAVAFEDSAEKSTWCLYDYDLAAPKHLTLRGGFNPIGADGACNIAFSPARDFIATANYSSGTLSVIPIDSCGLPTAAPEVIVFSGSGPDSSRQEMAHIHCVAFSHDGSLMAVTDLGSDRVYLHDMSLGMPTAVSDFKAVGMRPGSGPRHMVFGHDGKRAYLVNELGDDVSVLAVTADSAALEPLGDVKINDAGGRGAADIHLSPDGRHLYASARLRADGIAAYEIDSSDGTLRKIGFVETPPHPRNFMITPNGRYLIAACRDEDCLAIFSRDPQSGLLTPARTLRGITRPVFVALL